MTHQACTAVHASIDFVNNVFIQILVFGIFKYIYLKLG